MGYATTGYFGGMSRSFTTLADSFRPDARSGNPHTGNELSRETQRDLHLVRASRCLAIL